jgi:DedD protein
VVDNTVVLGEEIDPEEASTTEIEISESEAIFSREVPQLNASGLPEGWSVRLGSFSDADNAAALLGRLQAAGYKAYTRDMASKQGSLVGVFVGPWLNRAQVDDYQQQLQQEFNLAGLVVRYELESL